MFWRLADRVQQALQIEDAAIAVRAMTACPPKVARAFVRSRLEHGMAEGRTVDDVLTRAVSEVAVGLVDPRDTPPPNY